MKFSRSAIKDEVFKEAQSLCPGYSISEKDRVIEDLHMASDDFTDMALSLERRFGFKADRKLWLYTFSLKDIIDLVEKSVNKQS